MSPTTSAAPKIGVRTEVAKLADDPDVIMFAVSTT